MILFLISGADIKNVKRTDAGKVLSETLRHIMHEVRVPNGLHALGFTSDDIPALVKGTLPQVREVTAFNQY